MTPLIAVTGATGAVGRRLTTELHVLGARQRLVVRDRTRAPAIPGAEIREASGYAAGEEMRNAFRGADVVFLMPAHEAPDRVDQHRSVIDAAIDAGVARIVYLSFFGAAPDATFTLARDHWHTEQYVRAAGRPWTFLRMNLYADFIPGMVGRDGVIRGPAGAGRLAAILRDDVAAAAAAVLTTPGHDALTYDLTGPEAFTLGDAAEIMSEVTGRSIRFHDESDEEAFASRAAAGGQAEEVEGWVSSYWAIRDGSLQPANGTVRQLTGRDPVAFADYLRAHPGAVPPASQ